jgi:N-carbamoylputrescine amidase
VIVFDPASGLRFNRALLFDARGHAVASYDKTHIPSEEGFWESDHYEPGVEPPKRIDGFALPLGIQICSDLNRPQGCLMLGAQGVGAILAPRATPLETYERWRLVLRADAITSGAYVVSVNRPGPEAAAGIGGPSVVVAPDGRVVSESTRPGGNTPATFRCAPACTLEAGRRSRADGNSGSWTEGHDATGTEISP